MEGKALVDDLEIVLETVGDLVAGTSPEQWTARTPCPEWDVRELVNHMVMGHRLFADILRGGESAGPGALDPKGSDGLGRAPEAAYRAATRELLAEFRKPGALERTLRVPVGEVPGVAAVHLRAVEDLTHGWDLARATGQPVAFPADIVERAIEFTRAKLADVPAGRSPFAPSQPASADAPAIDRLAAMLGRRL